MAKVILNAYSASRDNGFTSIAFAIGGEPAFPTRTVEIARLPDAVAAFELYKADAAATGKALALSMMMGRGDRAPPGFNKLEAVRKYETVNL